MEEIENKVPRDKAIEEIQKFVESNLDVKKKDYEIEQDYPQMLKAVELGLLVFDEKSHPTLKLREPVLNDDKMSAIENDEVKFRNRIKPSQLKEIMKGLDIQKNQVEYVQRQLAYLTYQPVMMLDKFSRFDYKVIDQISTVFL